MERPRERDRNTWLYQLCVLSIGIPINRGDFIPVDPGIRIPAEKDKEEPQIPPRPPIPIRDPYYRNSIEEYRYSLYLANKSGSRTGMTKKKKSAESGIKFLQYSKSQREFMEFLSRFDGITYSRVIEYSNPSILKTPFVGGDFSVPDPRPLANIPSGQLPGITK